MDEKELKKKLTPEQYEVMREKGPKRRLAENTHRSIQKECINARLAERNFFLPTLNLIPALAGQASLNRQI